MNEAQKKIVALYSEILRIVYEEDRKDGPGLPCPHVAEMDLFSLISRDLFGALRSARSEVERDDILRQLSAPETWERYRKRYTERPR